MSEENKQEAQPTTNEQQLNHPLTDETVVPAETSTDAGQPITYYPQPFN